MRVGLRPGDDGRTDAAERAVEDLRGRDRPRAVGPIGLDPFVVVSVSVMLGCLGRHEVLLSMV